MTNPVGDFTRNWLNTTYEYLKKTGGPTYPVKTVGPDVQPKGAYTRVEDLPKGAYTPVEDLPEDWYVKPVAGHVQIPFNSYATGIPTVHSSRVDAVNEEARQNPAPVGVSKNFASLYGGMMNACISDQKHGQNNPNASSACQNLAETGDASGMILRQNQKNALGILPPAMENNKSDELRKGESLTGQISEGATGVWSSLNSFVQATKEGAGVPAENPKGVNFQDIGGKITGFVPPLPSIPQVNSGTFVMVAGGAILLILVLMVIK